MINSWNGRNNVDELQHLKGDRHYIILIPNPDDETNFSVMVADTFSSDLSERPPDDDYFNVANVVVKGIMSMLDSELDYLVEKGQEFIEEEYLEVKQNSFKNSENVIVFDPKKIKQ
tara:strand:+ start:646 stop:993 length:348 start_codon:yes stop_codon:yes gene_type:complete